MDNRSTPAGWSLQAGTLAQECIVHGRGLHTGRNATVRLLPVAPHAERQGITFRRIKNGKVIAEIAVCPAAWQKAPLCSTLVDENGAKIRTVEHLLAALLLSEIDEAMVEIDAEEVPILDGGGAAWVAAIKNCGRVPLPRPKRFIRILRPFHFTFDNNKGQYTIKPGADYTINCLLHPYRFDPMRFHTRLTPETFRKEIAPARTYGKVKMAIPALLGGLLTGIPILRGARRSNTIGVFNNKIIGDLRLPDEFVRHRILDVIGDFALAGSPLLANIFVRRPTHCTNHHVISQILSTKDAWEFVEF